MVPSVRGNPCDASWPEDALTGGVLRPRLFLGSRQVDPTVIPSVAIGPTLSPIANHYEVLGVPTDASPERIRAAYRDRARLHHPDRRQADTDDAMAAVNEAYRVLGDPVRRREFDRSIGRFGSAAGPAAQRPADVDDADEVYRPPPVPPSRMMPAGPARVPWKMMGIAAVVGSAVILFAAAFNDPPSTEVPDGIMRVGSCVSIQDNFDVREVACTGDGDIVVDLVIPTDATCPAGLVSYRDRLGLGNVCIESD